jgi:hypothetical protein
MMKIRAVLVLLVSVVVWCVVGVGAAVGAPGDLNTSFSTGGMVLTDVGVGSANDYGYAVAVDSQDRVVVAGYAWNGSNNDFAVVRYTSRGGVGHKFQH